MAALWPWHLWCKKQPRNSLTSWSDSQGQKLPSALSVWDSELKEGTTKYSFSCLLVGRALQETEVTLSSTRLKLALYHNVSQRQSTNSNIYVLCPQDLNVPTGRILLMFCNPERQNCLFFSVQFSLRAKTNTGWILGRMPSWANCSHTLEHQGRETSASDRWR